jgi:acyl-CoA oxidase
MIAFAHAGITAEGDNAVLFQKVTKELLAAMQNGSFQPAAIPSDAIPWTTNLNTLLQLFKAREAKNLTDLASKLQEGMSQGKSLFDIWMKEESDLIQDTARAHGEAIILAKFIDCINTCDASLKPILTLVAKLYGKKKGNTNNSYFFEINFDFFFFFLFCFPLQR